MRYVIVSLVGLLLLGCNTSDNNPQESKNESYLSKWNKASVTSYSFIYEERGFSPIKGEWEIQVHDNEVIFVNYVGELNPDVILNIESAPSINTLYEKIMACEANKACSILEVEFDDKYSFPSNYHESTGEEGVGFLVTDFVAQ